MSRLTSLLETLIGDNLDVEVACSIYLLAKQYQLSRLQMLSRACIMKDIDTAKKTDEWCQLSVEDVRLMTPE